jgi:hypothetical protein
MRAAASRTPGKAPSSTDRTTVPRCVFREGGRRCQRNGFGDPPLCRAHALVVDYEIDLDDPVGSLLDHADRFLSQQKDTVVSSLAKTLGDLLRPAPAGAPRPAAPPPRRAAPPPPPPPPPPEPPKENPRDVLGFAADVKLTRALVKERQRALAALMHPDKGGSTKALQRLNAAAAELLASLPK